MFRLGGRWGTQALVFKHAFDEIVQPLVDVGFKSICFKDKVECLTIRLVSG